MRWHEAGGGGFVFDRPVLRHSARIEHVLCFLDLMIYALRACLSGYRKLRKHNVNNP